jgi:putative mRNA 3-end processing factor
MLNPRELLQNTRSGLYCPAGDFYIDPMRKADCAIVTHGHADHARAGHKKVVATAPTLAFMKSRYGRNFAGERVALDYGEAIDLNGVKVWLTAAGHILGSAQVVVEYEGLRIIAAGDFKRSADPTCEPFDPTPCDVFITEATFALPVYQHPEPQSEVAKLKISLELFPERPHWLCAYSLGKAQRMIGLLREAGLDRTVFCHPTIEKINNNYREFGIDLGVTRIVDEADPSDMAGQLILAPPTIRDAEWFQALDNPVSSFASGWMRIRKRAKQGGGELPLIISDHADWRELTETLIEINPAEVWVTHGAPEALVKWCALNNVTAAPL